MDSPESQVSEFIRDAEPTEGACIVWHCRNLRVHDHPAIEYAVSEYEHVIPVFIFDPNFFTGNGLACDARIQFLFECLNDLDSQYKELGGELNYFHGDPITILGEFDQYDIPVVTTADPTGRYGLRRDNEAAETCDITFIDADGLRRDVPYTRDKWDEHVESWFNEPTHECEPTDIHIIHGSECPAPEKISDKYDVSPDKDVNREGGRACGKKLLREFIDTLPDYPGSISAPSDARSGTSQLSPYLRFGCLSVREVYQAVRDANVSGRCEEMFKSRLYWNRHYNQKLADWAGWMDTAVNPVLEGFHADSHDPELVEAWKQGETGYPMVDASMRCLKQTGWLNFRMRAMCASMLCDLLQQPWKIGADWFYYHLLDADPAINYTQFQLQAGVDGTNMMRVYNPRKQVRDNDPDGEFIKKWVPELRALPAQYLDRPEKTPVAVQEEVGVSIGDAYPYPIVEYEAARQAIIEKIEGVRDAAKRALHHPEVNRRASLSQRGGTTTREDIEDLDSLQEGVESDEGGQSSLDMFT